MSEIVAKVYRNDCVESVHCGSIVVVDSKGEIIYQLGDPYFKTYFRSSAKPFQIIPVLKSGAIEKYNITEKEIAVMISSHSGEERHVKTVSSILKKIGLSEKNLQCGTHPPLYLTELGILPRKEDKFSPLQHNFSGKHSGMLLLTVHKGWDVKTYLNPNHPTQKIILKTIADICEYPLNKIRVGTDGCGAPIFYIPIYNMARGFAKLAISEDIYLKQVVRCMSKYPEMVSGQNRFDLVLSQTLDKRGVCKGGAEGLHSTALLEKGWGVVVKISDGNHRAIPPVALEALRQMGILKRQELAKIENWTNPKVKNYQGKIVGYIKADFKLKKGD
ncbi:MAG TPA: asparaginase [candidate division Zixibacteria bacterium]